MDYILPAAARFTYPLLFSLVNGEHFDLFHHVVHVCEGQV